MQILVSGPKTITVGGASFDSAVIAAITAARSMMAITERQADYVREELTNKSTVSIAYGFTVTSFTLITSEENA